MPTAVLDRPMARKTQVKTYPMWIDGKPCAAADGAYRDIINPADGVKIARVPEAQRQDVDRAVTAARRTFESGVWSAKTPAERALILWRLAERLQCGTVMVNDVLATYGMCETPWGGVKASGLGVTHSAQGLRAPCEQRHVNVERIGLRREPWWYPYSDKTTRWLSLALRAMFGKRPWS